MANNADNTKETKRHMNVLLEHFNEKVDIIAEQHGSMMKNIQELRNGQKNITGEVEGVKGEIVEIKGDVKGLKEETTELKGDVKELKEETAELKGDVKELKGETVELKGDVKEIKGDVKGLKEGQENIKMVQVNHSEQFEIIKSGLRQKVDWKDFEVLEKRVLHLEAKVK